MRQRGEGCWRETLFSPHQLPAGSGIGISRVSGLHSSLRVRRARASSVCCIYCKKPSVQTLMHRYSHHIYWHIHKQNRLLCCKPPEIFPEGLIPPVVTSGQARRLRRHCLVPCASSFPRVQAPKLPCADCSASARWPCCMWPLLHVEPLHVCDLPAATFQQLSSSLSCFFSPYLPCSPRLRSNLPLLLPHMHAGVAP